MLLDSSSHAKPFLKWAGGKGQLIEQFKEFLPKEIKLTGKIDKYFEPFVGGGAVFFWLVQEYEIKETHLYDINPEIITAYKTIKNRLHTLIDELQDLEAKYFKTSKAKREDYYYDRRDEYNEFIEKNVPNNAVRRSALIIFLNKTCFNGLFRVNSQGLFNVPFGRYENPKICDEENLQTVSRLLKDAEIERCDFGECLKHADSKSFVYFDPPYRPISSTANFTGYIKNGFDDEDQKRLKNVFDELDHKGANIMLSNSDPKNVNPNDHFFDDLYRDYKIERLSAARMINCNASKRGLIKEILIMNYGSNNSC
jgi:DNA adenine methylase